MLQRVWACCSGLDKDAFAENLTELKETRSVKQALLFLEDQKKQQDKDYGTAGEAGDPLKLQGDFHVDQDVWVFSRTNMWREATVVSLEPDYVNIHYHSYASKFNEMIKLNSKRVSTDKEKPTWFDKNFFFIKQILWVQPLRKEEFKEAVVCELDPYQIWVHFSNYSESHRQWVAKDSPRIRFYPEGDDVPYVDIIEHAQKERIQGLESEIRALLDQRESEIDTNSNHEPFLARIGRRRVVIFIKQQRRWLNEARNESTQAETYEAKLNQVKDHFKGEIVYDAPLGDKSQNPDSTEEIRRYVNINEVYELAKPLYNENESIFEAHRLEFIAETWYKQIEIGNCTSEEATTSDFKTETLHKLWYDVLDVSKKTAKVRFIETVRSVMKRENDEALKLVTQEAQMEILMGSLEISSFLRKAEMAVLELILQFCDGKDFDSLATDKTVHNVLLAIDEPKLLLLLNARAVIHKTSRNGAIVLRGDSNRDFLGQKFRYDTLGTAFYNNGHVSNVRILHHDNAYACHIDSDITDEIEFLAWDDKQSKAQPLLRPAQIKELYQTKHTFAVLMNDGCVVTWGEANWGGLASENNPNLFKGVQALATTTEAIGILDKDSKVTIFTNDEAPASKISKMPTNIQKALESETIVQFKASFGAFAVRTAQNNVYCWGSSWAVDNRCKLKDIKSIEAFRGLFIGLKTDDTVIAWGQANVKPPFEKYKNTTFGEIRKNPFSQEVELVLPDNKVEDIVGRRTTRNKLLKQNKEQYSSVSSEAPERFGKSFQKTQ